MRSPIEQSISTDAASAVWILVSTCGGSAFFPLPMCTVCTDRRIYCKSNYFLFFAPEVMRRQNSITCPPTTARWQGKHIRWIMYRYLVIGVGATFLLFCKEASSVGDQSSIVSSGLITKHATDPIRMGQFLRPGEMDLCLPRDSREGEGETERKKRRGKKWSWRRKWSFEVLCVWMESYFDRHESPWRTQWVRNWKETTAFSCSLFPRLERLPSREEWLESLSGETQVSLSLFFAVWTSPSTPPPVEKREKKTSYPVLVVAVVSSFTRLFPSSERRKQAGKTDTKDVILTQKILTLTISGREGNERREKYGTNETTSFWMNHRFVTGRREGLYCKEQWLTPGRDKTETSIRHTRLSYLILLHLCYILREGE